jgi:hypothetical protein
VLDQVKEFLTAQEPDSLMSRFLSMSDRCLFLRPVYDRNREQSSTTGYGRKLNFRNQVDPPQTGTRNIKRVLLAKDG